MQRLERAVFFCIALRLFLPVAAGAQAQTSLTTQVHGERRTATVATLPDAAGVPYAPLHDLARQLGGNAVLDGTRVKLDLAGSAAFLWVDGTEVESAEDAFTIAYPVRNHKGEAWIAVADVAPLLTQGFRLVLEPTTVTRLP